MAEVERTAPAEFIEAAAKNYLEDLTKDYATQAAATFQTPLAPETFTGRQFIAGAVQAPSTASLAFSGYVPGGTSAATEEFNGVGTETKTVTKRT